MTRGLAGGTVAGVILDMGGVLLEMLDGNGLPPPALDLVGRDRLRRHLRRRSGVAVDDALLDRVLFEPWSVLYAARYDRQREAPWEPHLERLARVTGYREDPLDLLACWLQPYLAALRPLPGVPTAVEKLAARVPLAVVSNVPAPGRFYREVLDRHGLVAPFRELFFSYDEDSRKPAPTMIRRAIETLAMAPGQVLMVGDRRDSDVAAGRAAGTRTAWLVSERDEGPPPDLEAADLPALVERLIGGPDDGWL